MSLVDLMDILVDVSEVLGVGTVDPTTQVASETQAKIRSVCNKHPLRTVQMLHDKVLEDVEEFERTNHRKLLGALRLHSVLCTYLEEKKQSN